MSKKTEQVRSMTDQMLATTAAHLRREIPAAQALLSLVTREQRRRKRKAKKAAKAEHDEPARSWA